MVAVIYAYCQQNINIVLADVPTTLAQSWTAVFCWKALKSLVKTVLHAEVWVLLILAFGGSFYDKCYAFIINIVHLSRKYELLLVFDQKHSRSGQKWRSHVMHFLNAMKG